MPTVGELERAGWRFMRPNELWSPKKIRESEVDAAVREGLKTLESPPYNVRRANIFGAYRESDTLEENDFWVILTRSAWRQQHRPVA